MCDSKKAQQVSRSTSRDWILKTNIHLIMACDLFVFDFSAILKTISSVGITINVYLDI